MKRICVLIIISTVIACSAVKGQTIAAKTNLLYDVTTTINLGLEVGVAPKWTLELPVNYNPWSFPIDRTTTVNGVTSTERIERKIKHWLIQPEGRYWFCEKFNGHFVGLHGIIGGYNVGGFDFLGLKEDRYQGNVYGGGLAYGYHYILNTHWSIEGTIGAGVVYLDYKQYECPVCGALKDDATTIRFAPTKVGISIIYMIK